MPIFADMNGHNSDRINNRENGSTAILFVHGILGNREFFNFLMPFVPADWTVENLLFEGHGGTPLDFAKTTMSRWKSQVHRTVLELRRHHQKILIAAHPMGTLFAIREAVEGNADSVFLLNAPLRIRLTKRLFVTPWKIMRKKIAPDDVWTRAAREAYGIEYDANLFHYLGWIPRYIELFAEIRRVRKICPEMHRRAEVFLSVHDEMVSILSRRYFEDNPYVSINILPSSGHYYYNEEDSAYIVTAFSKFISL